jgi:hypothetical protein
MEIIVIVGLVALALFKAATKSKNNYSNIKLGGLE